MRSSVLIALVLAASALGAGCFDTPHQTRVRVTVDVSQDALTLLAAQQSLAGASGVTIVVLPTPADAGTAVDASSGADPLQREIYWDGSQIFAFDIELPAASYRGFEIQARGIVTCMDAGAIEPTLAEGHAGALTIRADSPTSLSATLASNTARAMCGAP